MILYRYFASHAFETLKDVRLKVSKVSTFNDPFEGMFFIAGDMTLEKARAYIVDRFDSPSFLAEVRRHKPSLKTDAGASQYAKDHLSEMANALFLGWQQVSNTTMKDREPMIDRVLRVVSFCSEKARVLDEILMWSHYASSHKGIRVGFEFPPDIVNPFKIVPVKYQDKRVSLDLTGIAAGPELLDALTESIKTKSTSWAYECEHRMLTISDLCEKVNVPPNVQLEFMPFDKSWVRRVDFGTRCDVAERDKVVALVKAEYPSVQCYQASYHLTDFSMEYTPVSANP